MARALSAGDDDAAKLILELSLRLDRLEKATAAKRAAVSRPKGLLAEICSLPADGRMDAAQARVWRQLGLLVG